jgi:tRNA pseudouridine32 synthase / 23S rRNA pseudouridine746 synthase
MKYPDARPSPSVTPDVHYAPPPDGPLDVVHLDDAVMIVDKPSGLLTVPGRGLGREDCALSRAARQVPDALVVHRLDMATSGLLALGRGMHWQRKLSMLFQEREVEKRYEAIVHGLVQADEGELDWPLITDWPRRPMQKVCFEMGKPALTRFKVLARDEALGQTRVDLKPVTGRSHQLRVHMLTMGHPIVGDPLYGDQTVQACFPRLMLHACQLSLPHPQTGQWMDWRSTPPF